MIRRLLFLALLATTAVASYYAYHWSVMPTVIGYMAAMALGQAWVRSGRRTR
jgi:hypothetical protein